MAHIPRPRSSFYDETDFGQVDTASASCLFPTCSDARSLEGLGRLWTLRSAFAIPGLSSIPRDSTCATPSSDGHLRASSTLFTRLLGMTAGGDAARVREHAEAILAGEDPSGDGGAFGAALMAVGFGAWE